MGLLLIDMVELNPTKVFSHATHRAIKGKIFLSLRVCILAKTATFLPDLDLTLDSFGNLIRIVPI